MPYIPYILTHGHTGRGVFRLKPSFMEKRTI